MKLSWLTGLVFLAGGLNGQTVHVSVENRSHATQQIVTIAEIQAGKIFSTIGVHVDWQPGPARLIVTLTDRTPEDFHPGELAAALPFEKVHIRILWDRIAINNLKPLESADILAHVMAHEIAHMLQGITHHSPTGIMRAHWKHDDFLAMQKGQMRFEPFDILLIQNGISGRTVRASNLP